MGPLSLGARRGWAGHCPLSPEPAILELYADHFKERNDSSSGRDDSWGSLRRGREGQGAGGNRDMGGGREEDVRRGSGDRPRGKRMAGIGMGHGERRQGWNREEVQEAGRSIRNRGNRKGWQVMEAN